MDSYHTTRTQHQTSSHSHRRPASTYTPTYRAQAVAANNGNYHQMKERFESAQAEATRLGFHNSPFFPKTLAEYTDVQVHRYADENLALIYKMKESQKVVEDRLKAESRRTDRERLAANPRLTKRDDLLKRLVDKPLPPTLVQPLFHNRPGVGYDGLSAIFADSNPFNVVPSGYNKMQDEEWKLS